ncbi:VOC family protein [Halopiger xanaduensis]|uniref:Glyoxalase/bleomycin resistance protein/dioxygenase n=1 Tax=Halopiger xanaduensis (strain DSM 18323 / JCM 14033 / SH-6) TaxID=797210 RepID=F8D975_HALXS|nr:VOC family protein [Halopiger xanaduensis]AEH35685.1 Glyoxalase/bleomycin resistance protein/dioxygenase [Halopiger xanaduensis SH-6]
MTANAHDLQSHHVGITVEDLEAVLPFYRDVLGFDVADRFQVDGEAFSTAVGVDDAAANFVHLEADGIRVEIVEYEPQARASPDAGLNQPGAKHLGFTVADLESFYADLPDDVETLSEPQTTATGNSILFLRDPEDNLVEVLEIAE